MSRHFVYNFATRTFFLFFYVVAFVLSIHSVEAATFSRNISTTVQVTSVEQVQVTQTHTLSWDDDYQYFPARSNALEVYVHPALIGQTKDIRSEIENLKVVNRTGNSISFTTSVSEGALVLKIPYYQDLKNDLDLVFKISYTTSLFVAQEGGLLDVMYPGIAGDFKKSEYNAKGRYTDKTSLTLNLIIPKSLGSVSLAVPSPNRTSTQSNTVTMTYTDNELLDRSVRVTVGDKRLVKFTLAGKTYPTNSSSPDFVKNLLVNYIEVPLPTQRSGTEFANQTIYYTKIDPFPESLRTDTDGNLIARFPVSAVKEGTVTIEGYAVIKAGEVPASVKKIKISDVPENMQPYMTAEPRYWQVDDPAIQTIATQQLDKSGFVFSTLQKSLGFVAKTLTYADVKSADELQRQGALGALDTKKGVCMEYSDLLLSVLRAQKIPTRTVFGDGVGVLVDKTLQGIGHQWVSVWFPEAGWISVDPTWSDQSKEYTGADFDHFVWYVASKSVNEPNGFHCQILDAKTPCKDALSINTESVNALPDASQLQTIEQVVQKVEMNKKQGSQFQQLLQQGTSYLGGSHVGRILLSTQAMLFGFAITLYLLLVFVTSKIARYIKKKREGKVIA